MPQKAGPKVKVTKDGPYMVSGNVPLSRQIILADKEGCSEKWKKGESYPKSETYALCRCGQSGDKPFCDRSHLKARFRGEETANRKPYLMQAGKLEGPELDLYDARKLCASSRFCERGKGVWELTELSADPKARKQAVQESCDCPSGRLVACSKKTGKPIEPRLNQSIGIVQDPEAGVSGPIWVRGGIPVVSSKGSQYEARNRVTLCRCGQSRNKPFCDGTHIPIQFIDGDSSLGKKPRRA
jgi:CDGSH-type Zn-finger protein